MNKHIWDRLEEFTPIKEFSFGHTPFQIEYFQTVSQAGNRNFEYWQHVLQLKNLHKSIAELSFDINDCEGQIEEATHWWPVWTAAKRKRSIPRLEWVKAQKKEALMQKYREAELTLNLLETKYKDLMLLKEDELLNDEQSFWAHRLSRQMTATNLSNKLGVTSGDLMSVLALPRDQQLRVLQEMNTMLNNQNGLLTETNNNGKQN